MMEGVMIADGIYTCVPFDVYSKSEEWSGRMSPHAIEYAVDGTMAHVKAAFDGTIRENDTSAYGFGRAFHCRLLEPSRFSESFAVAGRCVAMTKDGKGPRCSKTGVKRQHGFDETPQWYCSTHADGFALSDVEAITEREAEDIEGMRRRVFAHPALNLLRQGGPSEVCIAWTCPRTGVKSKTRLDKLIPELVGGGSCILDLKSCESASPRFIAKALEDYGWARAGAMRQDAMETLTGKRPDYYLIAIEKNPPYELCVPRIGEDTERGAKWELRANMATWAQCVKNGTYPGFGNDFVDIDVPAFKLKEYQALVPGDYV